MQVVSIFIGKWLWIINLFILFKTMWIIMKLIMEKGMNNSFENICVVEFTEKQSASKMLFLWKWIKDFFKT